VVEGNVESAGDVSIGSTGSFDGNIRAHHVVVSGYLHGKVECQRLEIVASGKVFGEVHSQEFVIEPGGQFVGESRVRETAPIAALRHEVDDAEPALDADLQEA
jgi:cytoskeletal protein CcmA (bactofilin family)